MNLIQAMAAVTLAVVMNNLGIDRLPCDISVSVYLVPLIIPPRRAEGYSVVLPGVPCLHSSGALCLPHTCRHLSVGMSQNQRHPTMRFSVTNHVYQDGVMCSRCRASVHIHSSKRSVLKSETDQAKLAGERKKAKIGSRGGVP